VANSSRFAPALAASPLLAGEGAIVGLDVGGSSMKAVVVGPSGKVVLYAYQPTPVEAGPDGVVTAMTGLLESLRDQAAQSGSALSTVGLAVPGVVDETAGLASFASNLGWRDLELAKLLSTELELPVYLGHDVRLGALGEAFLGSARAVNSFLFVPIGTGIASAAVLRRQLWQGEHGSAGEIGHVVVEPGGPPCSCGQRGCLEAVASAAALARRYRDRVPGPPVDAEQVVTLAKQGDPDALVVWSGAVMSLANVLAMVQAQLDLEMVVLGGGLAKEGPSFVSELQMAFARCFSLRPPPQLALAELGTQAACYGAALLARSPALAR
jgi:glucokinase